MGEHADEVSVTMSSKLVAEFIGTYLLVFTVGCNVLGGTHVWGGVSIACVLMVCIYALGSVSGAHFNPAVSVTLLASGKMDGKECGMYCGTQIVAGIAAGFSYFLLFGRAFNLAPMEGFGWLEAAICEVLYTFMLCFVVLNVAGARKWQTESNQFYGLAIGFVIVAGAYGAGYISGGCFNPAVAIAIDVSSAHMGLGWCLAYTLWELIGAGLAAALFKVVRPNDGPNDEHFLSAKLVSEFLGAFMLVFTVGLNVLAHSSAGAFSIAASLMCMIYALGDISGGHFNPAVTISILCSGRNKITPKDAGLYILAQLAGGFVAAFTYAVCHHGFTFPLGPGEGHTWADVATAEIVFTFVLCYVVLTVATVKNPLKDLHGLAIGSCVTAGGCAIGAVSGGSLNPAVSFGIASAHVMGGGFFYKAIIYSVFEIVGAVAAAGVFFITHPAEQTLKSDILAQ